MSGRTLRHLCFIGCALFWALVAAFFSLSYDTFLDVLYWLGTVIFLAVCIYFLAFEKRRGE